MLITPDAIRGKQGIKFTTPKGLNLISMSKGGA
jgi:hypothetical protein